MESARARGSKSSSFGACPDASGPWLGHSPSRSRSPSPWEPLPRASAGRPQPATVPSRPRSPRPAQEAPRRAQARRRQLPRHLRWRRFACAREDLDRQHVGARRLDDGSPRHLRWRRFACAREDGGDPRRTHGWHFADRRRRLAARCVGDGGYRSIGPRGFFRGVKRGRIDRTPRPPLKPTPRMRRRPPWTSTARLLRPSWRVRRSQGAADLRPQTTWVPRAHRTERRRSASRDASREASESEW